MFVEVETIIYVFLGNSANKIPKLHKIKLPDFAAIHKKKFEKMESIVEYKIRKDERSRELLSGQKSGSKGIFDYFFFFTFLSDNNTIHKVINKSRIPVKITGGSSKASSSNESVAKKNLFTEGNNTADVQKWNLIKSKLNINTSAMSSAQNNTIFKTHAAAPIITTKASSSNESVAKKYEGNDNTADVQKLNLVKSKLNINSSAMSSAQNNTVFKTHAAAPINTAVPEIYSQTRNVLVEAVKVIPRTADKMTERQNQHISLYKGKTNKPNIMDESKQILKGVRTNRRFELQMKFRQDIEDEQNT